MRLPLELVWIWMALTVPAWPVVDRFVGTTAAVLYAAGVGVALILAPRIAAAINVRRLTVLWIATFAVVVFLFATIYPRVNVHGPDAGSDDDDAHNVGAIALLSGESPYSRTTYLGNELHQLPGSFVLSIPFTLIGTSALQNLVCLPLFFLLLARESRDARTPLVLAWLAMLSPAVLHHIVTGSSYSWNAIWVLAAMWWVMSRPASLLAAVFLGVAMCSRANFLFLLAPLLGWLWRTHGPRMAIRAIGIASATVVALALPFYAMSPRFGPLEGLDRLRDLDAAAPGAGIAILVLMGLLACGLAIVRTDRAGLFLQCAAIQAFPVAAGLLLSMMIAADERTSFASYALFATWFVVMGAAIRIEPWLIHLRALRDGGQAGRALSSRA